MDQYPKSISKRPLTKWSNGGQNSGILRGLHRGCKRVAQGLHRGRRASAQRAHKEHAVPILPNFFAFQAREMKFGEQNGHGHYKFSVAHGHFKFSVAMDIREKRRLISF